MREKEAITDKRKSPQNAYFTGFLARLTGFEPVACRLGGDRSILLSYRRKYGFFNVSRPFGERSSHA